MKTKVIIIFLGVVLIGFLAYIEFRKPVEYKESDASSYKLQNELVCMVNDTYMGIEQIPVLVDDKTYYGCCEMCKDKLRNGDEHRYAQDPLTGEKVDKASAFIILESAKSGKVLYFRSIETFKEYKENSLLME